MEDLPRDSKILSIILQSVNVDDYDPQCIPMLYEIAYRYVLDVLQDAQVFADHANLKDISVDALKLAIESRTRFAPAPDSVLLHDLAQKKNRIPLPLVGEKYGLRLPPEKHLLTRQNFIIEPKIKKKKVDSPQHPSIPLPQSVQPAVPQSFKPPVPQPMLIPPSTAAVELGEDDDYDMDE